MRWVQILRLIAHMLIIYSPAGMMEREKNDRTDLSYSQAQHVPCSSRQTFTLMSTLLRRAAQVSVSWHVCFFRRHHPSTSVTGQMLSKPSHDWWKGWGLDTGKGYCTLHRRTLARCNYNLWIRCFFSRIVLRFLMKKEKVGVQNQDVLNLAHCPYADLFLNCYLKLSPYISENNDNVFHWTFCEKPNFS